MTSLPDLAQIEEARHTLEREILLTPVVEPVGLETAAGGQIFIKAESLQPTGSFKVRGASNAIVSLVRSGHTGGVVAYSTGNHAQAVARAAARAGLEATIVMSPGVPEAKLEATRALGASIEMSEATSTARQELAEQLAGERGLALIPPFEDPEVIAGQGTIALELIEQMPELPSAVFVPIGGGGLISGIAIALAERAHEVTVIGVEPAEEDDAAQSLRSGERVRLPGQSDSICDAVKVQELGDLTWAAIKAHVADIVTVSDKEVVAAALRAADTAHLLLEPAGALPVAAALRHEGEGPVVAVASGGNVTFEALRDLAGL